MQPDLLSTLHQRFGHASLRPAQATVIGHVLAGRDLLAVMPTGAGKSLCYQLPAVLGQDLTLVVSPLVALMADQVASLRQRGIVAAAWHAGQAAAEVRATTQALRMGRLRLVYVSPERLQMPSTLTLLAAARPRRVVVDEAHCVVRWGEAFRPYYLRIAGALAALGEPQLVALTGTATEAEQTAILRRLGRPQALRMVFGFDRPELFLAATAARSDHERFAALCAALRRVRGSALVYAPTRSATERLARGLAHTLGRPTGVYHAGLPGDQRLAAQTSFLDNHLAVLVATTAFGLGIDKPDVRAVLLAAPPEDLSELYQRYGRAGRDGYLALALMVHSREDFRYLAWQMTHATPGPSDLAALCGALARPHASGTVLGEDDLAGTAGLALPMARLAATALLEAGVLRQVAPGRWATLRAPRAGELAWLAERLTARRTVRLHQLDRVAKYASTRGCRRRDLLNHFGASPTHVEPPCCDNCLAAAPSTPTSTPVYGDGPTPRGAVRTG